jgi:hypothetical protein
MKFIDMFESMKEVKESLFKSLPDLGNVIIV